ncbi:MAG: alpha/beta hydrolase [Pseudomonadota bacterium]
MIQEQAGGIHFISGQWPLDPARPTLIFIHGATLNKTLWESQVASLSGIANTVAIDLPGHGQSPGKGKETIEEYARIVLDFIGEINPPMPIPCGLSMGGAIVQRLLIQGDYPFQGGILINTGARLKVMPMIIDTIKTNFSGFSRLLSQFAVSKANISPELDDKIKTCTQCSPDAALNDFMACDRFDVMNALGSITVPVLVISGSDDAITPPRFGSFLASAISNAVHVTLKTTGHLSPIEKPDDVNRAITQFMDGLNRRRPQEPGQGT